MPDSANRAKRSSVCVLDFRLNAGLTFFDAAKNPREFCNRSVRALVTCRQPCRRPLVCPCSFWGSVLACVHEALFPVIRNVDTHIHNRSLCERSSPQGGFSITSEVDPQSVPPVSVEVIACGLNENGWWGNLQDDVLKNLPENPQGETQMLVITDPEKTLAELLKPTKSTKKR